MVITPLQQFSLTPRPVPEIEVPGPGSRVWGPGIIHFAPGDPSDLRTAAF